MDKPLEEIVNVNPSTTKRKSRNSIDGKSKWNYYC
jgi:hypothetical protein